MPNKHKHSFIDDALSTRKKEHRFRQLTTVVPDGGLTIKKGGKEAVNFCSNDYLGLASHPKVINQVREFTRKYGAGSTASRLISGNYDIHEQLEHKLAETFRTEAALLFNSGFQANSSIISTITDRHSLILADKLSHNSLLQGSLLSRGDFQRFEHNDMAHLRQLLEKSKGNYERILIITETVFSMDGDRSDVQAISELAGEHEALLFVDDAHAVGVWGEKGLGLAHGISGIDIVLGTCGKAFGSFGSYVLCSTKMKDYLVNFCPGFIYTTALPPAVVGAIDAALELIPSMDDKRRDYHRRVERVHKELYEMGFDTGTSTTQIVPVIIGDEQETLDLSKHLENKGIMATAIRPPTVPEESSRIRITLSAGHTTDQIDYLLNTLKEWKNA